MDSFGEARVGFDAAEGLEADLGRERALAVERFAELTVGGLEFVARERSEASLENVDAFVDLRRQFAFNLGFGFADARNEALQALGRPLVATLAGASKAG